MKLSSENVIFQFLTLITLIFFGNVSLFGQIHIDQFGYFSDAEKVAVLSNPMIGFNSNESYTPSAELEVRNYLTDEIVFTGTPQIWNGGSIHGQSGDQGWWFDFSNVSEEGEYYIYDGQGVSSHSFRISDDVYQEVLVASTRMFYYNRCNYDKEAIYAGVNWQDDNNFLNALQDSECRYIFDSENASLEKDLTGGWFDAGDYNKYVTFAESAIHNLLWAYQENPDAFSDATNIPESGNDIPDIIDEIKWELDWLLKMINPDGSVHNKMGSSNYSDNTSAPPSANTDQRFYGPTCTSASLSASSMLSHAAEVFGEFPQFQVYSDELLQNAELCFTYGENAINNGTLETNCDNGEIVAGDSDRDEAGQILSAVIAAIHLYALTSNTDYNTFIVSNVYSVEPLQVPFWGPYTLPLEDALLYYSELVSGSFQVQNDIISSLTTELSNNYVDGFRFNSNDLYRSFIPDWAYHWGSNQPKAGYGVFNAMMINYNIDNLNQDAYERKASEQLHYFHGVNPLDLVMLSNMSDYGAEVSVNEIYHTWFNEGTPYDNAETSLYGPAPGYVTGGPSSQYSNALISPPYNQPVQKAYLDWNTGYPENSWEITEPAIYYQAMYIRLLANVMKNAQNNDFDCDPIGTVYGCTYSWACNYNEIATKDDGTCEFTSCLGCTYSYAPNYDAAALLDDGSCLETCPGDFNGDNSVTASDLTSFLAAFGEDCENLPD